MFFLPIYSLHLNIIGRLWLKIKCERPKPHHCESFEILTDAVEEILNQMGSTFRIDFGEIQHFTEFKTSFKFECLLVNLAPVMF